MEKAYCQKKTGDYAGSLATLDAARSASGGNDDIYYRERSEVLFFLDDRTSCLESIERLSAPDPARLKPLYRALRSTLLGTGLTNALAQYDTVLATEKYDLLALYGKARALLGTGETNSSAEQFILTGRVAFADRNLSLATNCFRKAQGLLPSSVRIRLLLAACFDEEDRPGAALAEIEVAARLRPTSSTLQQYRSDILERMGRKKEAYAAVKAAIALGGTNTEALLKAGYLATEAGKPGESVEWFERAGARRPADPALLTVVGLSLLNAGLYDRAVEKFETALRHDPGSAKVHYYLAVCYEKKGLVSEAVTNIKMELAANPGDADSWNFMGYLLADHGLRLDEAVDCVKRALSITPGNPFYLDSLGWAYFKLKRFPEAVETLESAVDKLDQQNLKEPEIYEHLGDAYYASGRITLAVQMWQKSLELDASNAGLKKKIQDNKKKNIKK
jgi:tetratricopeptide (TPR) repeat protein